MFLVHPDGREILKKVNPTYGKMYVSGPLEEITAYESTRPLRTTFGGMIRANMSCSSDMRGASKIAAVGAISIPSRAGVAAVGYPEDRSLFAVGSRLGSKSAARRSAGATVRFEGSTKPATRQRANEVARNDLLKHRPLEKSWRSHQTASRNFF
jgi:hypothetical protein